jgi:hypothetical protein
MVQPVPEKIDFPKEEEIILELWKKLDAFQTCLKQSKGKPRFCIDFCAWSNSIELNCSHFSGTPSTTDLPSQLVYPTLAISWLEQSKTSSLDMRTKKDFTSREDLVGIATVCLW